MKRKIPSSNALIMAESAARLGSFKKAGAELNVTASAISHQINSLETWLGFELFERKVRTIIPTESGERYLARVSDLLDELETITLSEMRSASETLEIRVQTTDSFANRFLVERLSDFLQSNPGLRVTIDTFEFTEPFKDEVMDVAILYGSKNSNGMGGDIILKEEIFPVCSPTTLLDEADSKADKLRMLPLIDDDNIGVSWEDWCSSAEQEIGEFDVSTALHGANFNHSHLALKAAELGAGLVLASSPLVQDAIKKGTLIAPFDSTLTTGYGYHLICTHKPKDYVTQFVDWLIEECQDASS